MAVVFVCAQEFMQMSGWADASRSFDGGITFDAGSGSGRGGGQAAAAAAKADAVKA